MVNTNHRDLTGVALHEPKGTAAATAGQVFVADGAGSGAYDNVANPAGTVIMFATDGVPTGYLECDGSSISTTTYATLFAVISYEYGGSGASFNIPDLRGQFIRGYDNSAGNDPDAATRTTRGDVAATTGDQVGTVQGDAVEDHTHDDGGTTGASASNVSGSGNNYRVDADTGLMVTGTSSTETRPINITMMFCIKT